MKKKTLDILNLLSESIILFLAPAAILTTLNHVLDFPFITASVAILNMLVCGYFGYRLNEYVGGTKIGGAAAFVIVLYTSRSVLFTASGITLKLGDLITTMVVGLVAVYLIRTIGHLFGQYALLVLLPVS
ncbi:MAG: hypothetical protein ACRC5C_04555, partial [Bacilli bacterium]